MNIYDLARESGVSIATASKAFNGRGDVSEETRAKVMEVAKRLHYRPSHRVRGPAQRRTENIALVAQGRRDAAFFDDPFTARVVEGVELELRARGYNLLLALLPEGGPVEAPKLLKNVDGLVVLGELPQDLLKQAFAGRLPSVLVGFHSPKLPAHYLLIDNRGGEHRLVGNLAEQGHRHLAFVAGPAGDYNNAERRAGFEDACTVHKIQGEIWDLSAGGWPKIEDEIRRRLQAKDRPGAVLAEDDEHALAVLRVARGLGLQVPRDLSVAGFNDSIVAELAGLSTLRVDGQGMGRKAVQRIFRSMEQTSELSSFEEVPVEWVVRGSTGPLGA